MLSGPHEDIHSFVEAKMIESLGTIGKKIHTARSRNDQVATDMKLYVKHSLQDLSKLIEGKKAIVSNKKYFDNDYKSSIYYKLDGVEQVMYIFYVDDLLVIQVGNTDEGCKFIAYR